MDSVVGSGVPGQTGSGARDRAAGPGEVGRRAEQGGWFGRAAGDYDAGRPGWPSALLDTVIARLGLAADAAVVDLAAGTGQLTRVLADRFPRLAAVEPLAPMRERLAARLPAVSVFAGRAEQLPLPDGCADAVFVAEAFHWFDGPRALAEIARVLRPGGALVLLWNQPVGGWQPALPEAAVELARAALARGGEPGGALVERGEWRAAFDGSRYGPLQEVSHDHELVLDRDGVVANLLSISTIAGLPAPERSELREQLTAAIPVGRYCRPLRSTLFWTRAAAADSGYHAPRWCDHCGAGADERDHSDCRRSRTLEPPRFCPHCRRRMKVQVLPAGWTATCVAHGDQHAP